jgi:hypothetical protein
MKLLSEDLDQALNERVAYPTGTVRTRKAGDFIKTAKGDWERVKGDPAAASKHQRNLEKMAGTVADFQKALGSGSFDQNLSFGEHVKLAKAFRSQHEAGARKLLGSLTDIAGAGAKVKARTKNLESMLGKMVRKPKYKRADQLKDGTGARIVHKTIDEVKRTVAAIKAKYKTLSEDEEDYINNPKEEGYQSHHLVIVDDDGLAKEVQVRTANQDLWADWFHDAYKPTTPIQAQLVEKNKDTISEYAKKMADHFFQKDSGKKVGQPPPCPDAVKSAIGCMGMAA